VTYISEYGIEKRLTKVSHVKKEPGRPNTDNMERSAALMTHLSKLKRKERERCRQGAGKVIGTLFER